MLHIFALTLAIFAALVVIAYVWAMRPIKVKR